LRDQVLLCNSEDGNCKTAERKLVPVPSTDLHKILQLLAILWDYFESQGK